MSAPDTHEVVLSPPKVGMADMEMYKHMYEQWKRTGGYQSTVPNLKGLNASVKEINTLVGISTDDSVQEQIDTKADSASLGTMSVQDANTVSITGGGLSSVNILDSIISQSNITVLVGDTSTAIALGGVLTADTTPVGNIGTGEDTLITYSLLANSINAFHDHIDITAYGIVAANANNKTIKLKIGTTTILDTTAVAANSGSWTIEAKIIRKADGTQQSIAKMISDNTSITNFATYTDVSEDLTTNLAVFCTGEATSNDDIVQKGLIIKWFKA